MSEQTKVEVGRPVGRPGETLHLRGAILGAALRQLETAGSQPKVTIAAIVKEARCTPPSLYHYWPSRELLLQEASAQGWTQFRATQAGSARAHLDPVERLRLRGKAYLEFALARPALFRVLFLEQAATVAGSSAPPPQIGEALQELVTDVMAAMAGGALRPADPLTTALALWSATHGVAALWTVTPSLPEDLAHAVGKLAQDAVLVGLAASPFPEL